MTSSSPSKRLKSAEDEPPSDFICPITHEIMREPVVAADGNTYERRAIEKWIENKSVSPFTREQFSSNQLYPNRILSNMIKASKFYVPIPEPISKRTRDSKYVLKDGGKGAVLAIHADRMFIHCNRMIHFDGLNVLLKDKLGKVTTEIYEFIPSKDAFILNTKEKYWDLVFVDDSDVYNIRWIYAMLDFVCVLEAKTDVKADIAIVNALRKLLFKKLKLDIKKFKI